MGSLHWRTVNPHGRRRVLVTKELPGTRWLQLLTADDCRVDVCASPSTLTASDIRAALAGGCAAVLGQLTEPWNADLLRVLKDAGGGVYANYAVGFDNVDVEAATRLGLPVGNTPGVLTQSTAELAVALTLAAARRIAEGDAYMRAGRFTGWHPTLLLGQLLERKALGVVGAGRIGVRYAQIMQSAYRMDVTYFDIRRSAELEDFSAAYSAFLEARGEQGLTCRRAASLDELLAEADVVSVHTALREETRHLLGREQFARMKRDAIFVNTSRGALHDEAALVDHCRTHPTFRAALDVYENEPAMCPGLSELPNVVVVPHLGSATGWTREGMAALAAANVLGILNNWPVWNRADIRPFLSASAPKAAPSIVNATELGLERYGGTS